MGHNIGQTQKYWSYIGQTQKTSFWEKLSDFSSTVYFLFQLGFFSQGLIRSRKVGKNNLNN